MQFTLDVFARVRTGPPSGSVCLASSQWPPGATHVRTYTRTARCLANSRWQPTQTTKERRSNTTRVWLTRRQQAGPTLMAPSWRRTHVCKEPQSIATGMSPLPKLTAVRFAPRRVASSPRSTSSPRPSWPWLLRPQHCKTRQAKRGVQK